MAGGPRPLEPLDRPYLLFTDEAGRIILLEDGLALFLGFADPEDAVGEPVDRVLGIPKAEAEGLMKELFTRGEVRNRPIQAVSRRTGTAVPLFLSGMTQFVGGRRIGADIAVCGPSYSVPDGYLDHCASLERLARIARTRLQSGAGLPISEARLARLAEYFAARVLALHVLLSRLGGRSLAGALQERLAKLARDRSLGLQIAAGRVAFDAQPLAPETLRLIIEAAVDYAAKVTSLRLVRKELADLDAGFDTAVLEAASRFGLRPEA